MFSSLSEIFGRNFLIGYFLPAVVIMLAFGGVYDFYCGTQYYARAVEVFGATQDKLPIGRIVFVFAVTFALAALLLAINYNVTRLMEGYVPLKYNKFVRGLQLRRFRRLKAEIAAHESVRDKTWTKLSVQLAEEFPETEVNVLPTRFGNVMRAYERYAQVVYNIEPIRTWARLEPLLPDAHRSLLEDAKAQLDFWINLWFGGLVFAALTAALSAWDFRWQQLLFPLGSLLFAYLVTWPARTSAQGYGALVRSAFDLYRGDLCSKLGLEWPLEPVREREMWQAVSWCLLYPEPTAIEKLAPFRKTPSSGGTDGPGRTS